MSRLLRTATLALAGTLTVLTPALALDIPASCWPERLQQPQPQAEAVETWAWRIGRLRAQLEFDPSAEDEQLRATLLAATQRLLALAAVAESQGDEERAAALRELVQRGLPESRDLLDQRAADADLAAIAARTESLWHGVLHPREPGLACAALVALDESRLSLQMRFRLAQCQTDSDPTSSLALMQASAADGHPAAAEALALLCRYGRSPDLQCLLRWGCAAVGAGRPRLAPLLAESLLAEGDAASAELAARLLGLAAAGGDAASMVALGDLFASDRGGPPQPATARRWYERAAELGSATARERLDVLDRR